MAPPRRSRRLALKRVRIGDLPTSVLTHILTTATSHDDLLAHVALCARVHPEWRRAVMGSAAYGRGIVGRSAEEGATETAAEERSRVLRKLTTALRQATTDGKLALPAERVGDAGARALEAAVRARPSPLALTDLNLHACLVTTAGVATIAGLLRDGRLGRQLKSLDVSVNRDLGDAGVTALAAVLPPTLESAGFAKVECGDAGMLALARALDLTSVGMLVCNDNPAVTEAGWGALGAALPPLRWRGAHQSFNGCFFVRADLGDAGAAALANRLPESGIVALLAGCCRIGDAGARALAAVIPRCPQLLAVELRQNPIGADGGRALGVAQAATAAARPLGRFLLNFDGGAEDPQEQAG